MIVIVVRAAVDIEHRKYASASRRKLLTTAVGIPLNCQMLNVWKQVSLTILGSKIFWGLVALGNRYAVCKGQGLWYHYEL